jgi:hypothetical protein
MKQHEAVKLAMEELGGFSTFGQLYQSVPKIPNCEWKTKTPFASIRRIVQTHPDLFYRIRPGLWALTSNKKLLENVFNNVNHRNVDKDSSHSYYQGLLVEIGNLKRFLTIVPNQDKNKPFGMKSLSDVVSSQEFFPFTNPDLINQACTIDVVWFNSRYFPDSFFEVEHSSDINRSLVKFMEFQDFISNYIIVADKLRREEYISELSSAAISPIKTFMKFWDYDSVIDLHSKVSAMFYAEKLLKSPEYI